MAHFAFLNNENIVVDVIVGRDEDDLVEGVESWEEHYGSVRSLRCLQTSYNTSGGVHYIDGEPSADQSKALRYNYAGIGFTYDEERDAFIPPKPFPSWLLDEDSCTWEAPIPMPNDGQLYRWDEAAGNWVQV